MRRNPFPFRQIRTHLAFLVSLLFIFMFIVPSISSATWENLSTPGTWPRLLPQAINNQGQVVGGYSDTKGIPHGFIYAAGHYTILNAPGAGKGTPGGTSAWAINNKGQVVGYYFDVKKVEHGFLYTAGHYTILNAPGAGKGVRQGRRI